MSITPLPPADFVPSVQGYSRQGAFRFWCQTVLPLVYDDSLSYYELLNKVVNYLNNLIKDTSTLENNYQLLYEAFVLLQKYVNTYFDSLDVQEEINNKLDAMVCDGTFAQLVFPYLGYIPPELYGAKGDGETDDTASILSAFTKSYTDNLPIYFSRIYKVTQEIIIENVPDIIMEGTLIFPDGSNGLRLGSLDFVTFNKTIKLNVETVNKTENENTDNYGIKLINICNSQIDVHNINGFHYGLYLIGDGHAFAYNTFRIESIRSVHTSLYIERANGGYNNENLFIGGRYVEYGENRDQRIAIRVNGNNHCFLKPCTENCKLSFDFVVGRLNTIISHRGENSDYIARFDSESRQNLIQVGYGTDLILDFYAGNKTNTILQNNITNAYAQSSLYNILGYTYIVAKINLLTDIISLNDEFIINQPFYYLSTTGDYRQIVPSHTITDDELSMNYRVGVMVSAKYNKNFIVIQNGNNLGTVFAKCYDSDNNIISADINIGLGSHYSSESGGYYLTTASYNTLVLSLPENCVKAFIGVKGSSSTKLQSFIIKSNKPCITYNITI